MKMLRYADISVLQLDRGLFSCTIITCHFFSVFRRKDFKTNRNVNLILIYGTFPSEFLVKLEK